MANIADLIANRNQELEDFKQKKQEERTEAYERRDAAVMEVTSDPEKYRAFLDLHAQTMYNAANTATVWKQRPGATQLLPRKKWAELGRKIREDETPVQVFMRDTRSGYIKLDYVYDKAQTVGDPVPVRGILRDGTPDMEKALGALLQSRGGRDSRYLRGGGIPAGGKPHRHPAGPFGRGIVPRAGARDRLCADRNRDGSGRF